MKKIIWPGLVAGFGMLAFGLIWMFLLNLIFPSLQAQYQNIEIFRPWSDPRMMIYFLYPFLTAVLLAWIWGHIKNSLPGGTLAKKGMNFGFAYWLVASIPGMFVTYTSFQVSSLMIIGWTVSGLIEAIIAGMIIAKMNK